MKYVAMTIGLILVPSLIMAHSTSHDHEEDPEAALYFAALERTMVDIRKQGNQLVIESNGIPNHSTGSFPNRNNPHSISAQNYNYRVPANPQLTGKITEMRRQPVGVALNGIPFDPGTAECYGQSRGSKPSPNCEWSNEAIVNGKGQLGLDNSNAHVQPTGAYHYHGIPNGLLSYLGKGDLVQVGFAADGFKMLVSRSGAYKPSYRLKSGTRSGGPGGRHDGTYTQDFTYVKGLGDLDECNGTVINGEYAYVLTTTFPNIPRCWKGTPDTSFSNRGSSSGGRDGRRPPPHKRPRI